MSTVVSNFHSCCWSQRLVISIVTTGSLNETSARIGAAAGRSPLLFLVERKLDEADDTAAGRGRSAAQDMALVVAAAAGELASEPWNERAAPESVPCRVQCPTEPPPEPPSLKLQMLQKLLQMTMAEMRTQTQARLAMSQEKLQRRVMNRTLMASPNCMLFPEKEEGLANPGVDPDREEVASQ